MYLVVTLSGGWVEKWSCKKWGKLGSKHSDSQGACSQERG